MPEFQKFARAVKARFDQMSKHELYVVDVDDLFDKYLAAFPEGTNPIYRVRTYHDGSYDKHFIRAVGNVVSIADGKVSTLWDLKGLPYPYDVVAKRLDLEEDDGGPCLWIKARNAYPGTRGQ